MDGTENLIAFEEPEVRERRLKAQQIKGMLERLPPPTTFAQPFGGGNLAIPARPQSMSSPPSMIFSPVQTIPRSDGSSEGNSFESCQSTTDWEKFEDDSTISSAPTVTDNVSLSGISFIAEETVQPTEPLLITNPFCSQTAPGKRHLSSDLIELDDDWDVLRRFDPIVSSLSMPKVGNVTVVRTRDKVKHADTATLPLTIVNKGRFDDSAMQRSNSTSSVSSKRSLSIKPFSFADLKLTRKESTVVTQLKRLESKLSAKLEANGSGDNITHWSQGVIISPRSKISNPPWLVSSVKLIVHTPKEYSPLKFTCSVSTEVESLIYQVLYSINSEEPASSYALKIWGKDEYLVNESGLAEYVHVYTSIKLNKDIELSLVSTDLLLCQHMQQEGDRNSDEEKKPLEAVCSRVIPTLIQEIPMRELLKQLTNESSRLIAAAANGEPVETTKFCQLLKALCAVFRAVVPFDLNDSIDRLKSAAHSLSDERRTLMRSPNAITSPPRSSPEYISQFNKAMQSVCGSVHRLIATFCQNPTSEFVIEPVEERQTDTRELISLEYQLLFCAESLHNLPANWITDYEKFILKCFVFYGTASLLKGEEIICGPATVDHSGFYPAVYFKQLIQIDSCELCILPREARLSFVLHGMRLVPVNETNNTLKPGTENGAAANDHFTMAELGWSSVCLFDNDGHLRQGPVVLSFAKTGLFQPWGTDSTCFCPDSKSVQLLISFTRYQFDVRFPEVEAVDRTSRGSNNPTMDEATRTYLNDIIFNQDPNYGLQPDEKDTLWEKRYGLIDIPDALPLVLSSAIAWDWASLNNTYHLLNTFTPLCPVKAMDLLLPKFPDKEVRRKAVEWISVASADDLINYLPQLVEVLRFELREDSDIAAYLLSVASCDWKFAHRLYWQLEERCSLAEHIGLRCRLLKEVLMRILGARGTEIFQREKWLLSQLDTVAAAVKNSNNSSHRQILMKHLDPLDHQLNSEGVCLPIEPAFKASGFELPVCSYFESKTRPLDLVFKNAESSYGAIYKVGDDLRQDALVIQLVSLMERIWLNAGLDLKVLTFQCLPTGKCKGLVEKVPHSRTLRQIQVEGGGLTGSFRDSLLVSWIQKHNPSELDYEIALANFRKSSSAWCVCSYVLGLGDRHNDNILITTKGHVFHIDFGKYLGDFEKFGKFKRDRVPFVLTSDMAYVINAGSKQKTTFQEFVDDCCKAFNCLRNNSFQIMSALKLMVCSGIPGVSIDAVRFVHQKLLLDRTDTEATARFSRMIMETLKSIAPKMNFFIHNLAQWNSAASDENPSQLLSFTPATFSLATEGKIVLVEVLSCEKRQLPEKHYLFKMNVYREQETVATVVYRTYKEFYEFFEKIYMRFPLAEVCALSGGPTIGRSNIRVVAEGQKLEIIDFLDSLFSLSAEVAHCDLVYTFFHPLLRDQQEAERSDSGVGGENTGTMAPVPSLTGSIKLSVSYSRTRKELEVFVQHVKNLIPVGGRLPDTYVKIYLRPDPIRASKRKTKVEKSNCNPVFMERFVYLYPPAMLKTRQLELTVWQHDYLKENSFLGGVQMPLTEISAIIRHQYVTDSGTTYVDMVSARLADYFVVIGFDHSKQRNGSSVGKIIQRFPEFDWPDLPFFQGLELFCQPLGWTVSRRWQPPTFFIAVLTDVGADRHYCACLTFWESHGVEQTMSPDEELDDDTDNRIVKQNSGANLSDAYGAVTVLYSPKCLVLISRHEFFEVFKNSLGIVYSVYIDKMAVEIEQLVGTILGSVQVPPAGGPQLRFTIGAGDRQVLQPCGRSSIPVTGARVAVLFHQLGIHNVVTLFCAMITERKILFHSQSFTRLTDACHALSALMYPLKYSHVYVPLLPAALLEVLNTPTPFLMGVHSSLRHLITDIVDVITVDLDGGSIFLPDSAPVPPMPEPFLGRLMMWLTLVLNREVFTADRAFPSNGSNSSLSNISGSNAANNGGKNSQAMTDKQVRSCFLRLLANMLVEYRSCLQIVRIHPKPVITFHRTAFLGLRSLNESDFMCRFVDSMAFCQFVCERGVPFRSVDLFDEVYTNCSQTFVDEEVNFDLVLDNIQVLAQQLYVNENPTNQPTIVEKIPRPAEQSLSELPSPSFPLLDATKIQVLIDEGIAQMSKSPQNSPGPEGPLREVPSIPMGFRKHTGLPDGNLRRIEVMKTCLRCVFESKILEARKTLPAVLLSLKNRSVRVAFCKELAGRLHDGPGNRAQLEPQQFDLVVRMMNCALQNGSASDEYGIAYALLSLSTMYCRKLCTGVIQFAYTCIQDHPVWLNQGFWEAAFYHDVQTQIKSLYVNTTGTNVSANLVANRDNLWDLWNLYEEPRTIDVAADQMKTSATMDAGRLRELSAQEESIVYSQAIHYANRMVYLHIPLDVTKLRQLSNLNSLEDTFSSRMSNSNATNSVSNDESDRSSGAESGFVEGADGNASSRGAVVAKFVSKFVDRVCSDAGVTQEHISQLHQMTMGVIQMHIEYLEGVHRESKRLPPIRKPKMLTPSFLRDEKMLSGYQRAYLMPDGRDENLKLVEKALLPAEGTVFLTNYRIIFKGQPCNPYLSEKVVMRVIPVMAMTKQKKIGQQYLSHGDQSGQFLSEAIQIRSTTFQLMKLAFDDEVGAEKVESFCTALTNLRWSETLSGQLYALSSTVADPTADMDTLKPGKKGNTFSRNIKKTLNVAAKKTGLTGTLNKAMFNGGNHFKGGQTKYSMTGVTSPLTLNTAASTQSSTLPSSPKRQSPASDDESDRSTPTRDEDVVSATPNGRSGSLSRTLEKLSERPYCHDYQRLGLCSRAEVTLHSGAALTRTGSTSLKATEGPFRLTTINKSYSVCRSYPSLLVVPHNVNDESLRKLAKGHKHGRFPVVVWSSSRGAFLMRAAGFHLKSVVGRLKGKAQTMAAGGSTKDYSDRTQAPAESLSTGLKSRAEQELYFLNLVTIATRANLNNIGHSSSGTSDAALGSPVNLSGSNESLLSIDSLLLGSLDSVSITGVPSSSNLAGMNGNNQGDNSSLYSTPVIDRRFGGTPLSSLSRYMKGSGGKGLGLKFNTMRPGRPLSTVGSNLSVPSLTSGRKTNGNSGVKDSGPPALQRASLYIFGEKSQAKTLRLDTKCHFVPIEFTEVRQMKASLKKFLRVVAPSSAPEANSSFLRELEQSEWLQQIKLMIQVSCAVIDLVDIQNSSVAICLEDGYDFTPQVVSLSQLMLDPFYRTIDGFRVLVEKEWLSFGHRFSHRCNHTFASSTSGFAPVFLQFLDAVHQIHRQFPESFEFNDFYLRFIAYHSVAAYFQTFLFDCEADRVEEGLIHYEGFYPHSQWKSIGSPHHPSSNPPPVPHRSGRSESTSVDPGNTADHLGRSSAHLVDSMSKRANSLGRAQRAEQLLHSSLFDYIDSKHSHGSLFYNFLYAQHSVPNRVLRPQFCVAALDLWDYYVEDPLALGSTYDLEGAQAELTERQTDEADLLDGSGNLQSSGRKQIDLNYDSVDFVNQNPFQLVLEEIYNAEAEPTKKFLPRRWDDVLLKIRQIMQREEDESEQIVDATSSWATWLNRAMHKKSTVELLLRGRSKELGRFQNVGGDSQPHQFVRHNFSGAHNCDFCGHIIWGVVSQGLKCSACDYICHEKCQIDVPNHCRNTHANTETNTMRNPLIIEEAPRMVSETRTHEGYLFKRGHLLKGWKQRWFVLDSMKHQLRYYECMEDSECRGYIDLGEVVSIDPVMSTLPNAPRNKIEETYFDLKTTRREYHFAAASAQQAQEWIEKIRQCVTA